ncbi:MAG: DUF2059 domain-containing protein [Rhizobiales bacterium]|nr:DUF2059 domain-containing protein [Hyphomicrobiales bacterium]
MRFIQTTHRAIRVATVAVVLALASPAAYAQQPSATAIATAKEIVAVTGATASFNPLISGVVEQAKLLFLQQNPGLAKDLSEITAKLRTDLAPRFQELVNDVAKNYATSFTEQELKDILAFYKSPSGAKLIANQPKVVDASLKFAQTWANTLSEEVIAKMRDELKKKGHAL